MSNAFTSYRQNYTYTKLMEKGIFEGTRYYVEVVNPLKATSLPVVMFLHGQGERSDTNLDLVLRYGPIEILRRKPTSLFPGIYVQPQLSIKLGQWNIQTIARLTLHIVSTYKGDLNRLYLGGVSLGGHAIWNMLSNLELSKMWAAAFLCSPGNIGSLTRINSVGKLIGQTGIPMWISHAKDDSHPYAKYIQSEQVWKVINTTAGYTQAQLTHYGLTTHSTKGAWGKFMEPENYYLWEWLKFQINP